MLWINPYPGRLPRWSDLYRSANLHNQGTAPHPQVDTADFVALPIEPLPGGYSINKFLRGSSLFGKIRKFINGGDYFLGVGKPCSLAIDILKNFPARQSFYDAMDDFPVFHTGLSRKTMAEAEFRISHTVDVVYASSLALEKKFQNNRAPVKLVRNACDMAVLPLPREEYDMVKPILGYVGSMGDWFDWELLCSLAIAAPFCEVRLIGPQLVSPPSLLPKNVVFMPACRHDEVGRHLAQFNVGLIPFKKTPLTNGVDPIKYYEYRAMGIPILASNFGEIALRHGEPGIFFLDDAGGLEMVLNKALSYSQFSRKTLKWRAENSWSARFKAAGLFAGLTTPISGAYPKKMS